EGRSFGYDDAERDRDDHRNCAADDEQALPACGRDESAGESGPDRRSESDEGVGSGDESRSAPRWHQVGEERIARGHGRSHAKAGKKAPEREGEETARCRTEHGTCAEEERRRNEHRFAAPTVGSSSRE